MTTRHLFVVAAPSGAGKTSLVRALVERHPELAVAVSHTTRKQRPGEENAVNYFFVDVKTFKAMQQDDAFLESARVFGNYYGTSHGEADRILDSGQHLVLEIDWQGARQVRDKRNDVKSIFILPPSLAILRERLKKRDQDDDDTVASRMATAIDEISHYAEFDYLVVNEDFERAVTEMEAIVDGEGGANLLENQQIALKGMLDGLLGR